MIAKGWLGPEPPLRCVAAGLQNVITAEVANLQRLRDDLADPRALREIAEGIARRLMPHGSRARSACACS